MKLRRAILSFGFASIVFLLAPIHTLQGAPGLLPPGSIIDGRSIADWTAECWKWVYSIPTNQNPHFDCEGRWATNRQPDGLLFFVAPLNVIRPPQTNPCVRTFTIPENKFILMPLLPATADNFATEPPMTVPELSDLLDSVLREPVYLHASFDGITLTNLLAHRTRAPAFSFHFPTTDHILAANHEHPITGLVDPIASDGYWLMFTPFLPGQHVIAGGGGISLGPLFTHEIVLQATVVRVPLAKWVEDFGVVIKRAALPQRTRNSLATSLAHAQEAFASGKVQAGIEQLRAFERKVKAMVEPRRPALAQEFSSYAERIVSRARADL